MTSRHTLGMLGGRLLDLDVLGRDDAVELLRRALVPIPATPGSVIIRVTPRRSRACAATCRWPCRSLPRCWPRIKRGRCGGIAADLAATTSRLEELRYENGLVRAAFDLSYQHLDARNTYLFRLLSVSPGPDISTEATAVLAGLDKIPTRHTLETLARAHLIERAATYGRWRMHDLLRLYADERGRAYSREDSREQARDRLLGYDLDMATAANHHLLALPDRAAPEFADRDSALAWLDAERPNLIAAAGMAAATGRDEIAQELPFRLGVYLDWRRRFQ